MGETRKIVTENYPAHKLPEDLRRGLEDLASVRVTVETEDVDRPTPLTSFIGSAKGCYHSPSDAVSGIRSLRDEWE